MSAVPAYSYYPERAPERAPGRTSRPRVRVVPGQGTRTAPQTVSPSIIVVAKAIAVVLVVATVIAIARISLLSATVSTSLESQTLSSSIEEARSAGNDLEVAQSTLASPTRIKTEAGSLKMAAPESVETIVLGPDVVATDDAGNLSLAKSIAIATGTGA